METELIEKIKGSISNIEQKKHNLYFFVQDTRGNARASLAYMYEMAMTLHKDGFNVIMLHEKNDFIPVTSWMGESYGELTHQSVEGTNLQIAPEDIIIVPEVFGYIMEQVKNLPCGKIVLCQAYDHMIETLNPGVSWNQLGFMKCITTSETQKEAIDKIMKRITVDVVEPVIYESFKKQQLPPKPIIGVVAREQREGINLIKQFYLKYPQYRFFTFRDLRGLSRDEFANTLQDCFLGVWLDPTSGFGTFPLECMMSGVPVLGQIPYLKPSWMNEKNGVWVDNPTQMVDIIADIVQTWLEDNMLEELYTEGEKTATEFTNRSNFETKILEIFSEFSDKRKIAFEAQIEKQN
jgi:hypothetical protein